MNDLIIANYNRIPSLLNELSISTIDYYPNDNPNKKIVLYKLADIRKHLLKTKNNHVTTARIVASLQRGFPNAIDPETQSSQYKTIFSYDDFIVATLPSKNQVDNFVDPKLHLGYVSSKVVLWVLFNARDRYEFIHGFINENIL